MHRLALVTSLGIILLAARPAAGDTMLYATAATVGRVDGFCVNRGGALTPGASVHADTGVDPSSPVVHDSSSNRIGLHRNSPPCVLLRKFSAQRDAVAAQKTKQKAMKRMVELAHVLKAELQKNNLAAFGEIIHENWLLKRSLSPDISSGVIDDWYARARKAGASGGKLLGAGSGGFLMFYAKDKVRLRHAMHEQGLREVRFRFDFEGTRIVSHE